MREARESMPYDVVIVGAGPAGLSAAIRLKQRANENDETLSLAIVEKGAEVGSHIISGAVLDPKSLDELIPDWREREAPIHRTVTTESFQFLNQTSAINLPIPPSIRNQKGNYIISLGLLTRWLAEEAEALGVEIYPGFAASEVLYHPDGSVKGIATGDMGIGRDGKETPNYMQGMELHAQQTLFAEGCRGSLSQQLIKQFGLDADSEAQTYGLGIKEVWEVDSPDYRAGSVRHTVGWPLDKKTYGGSFIYHLDDNQVALGMVVGLDYQNPYLSPFEEFQRFKTHPSVISLLKGGRRIAYGARALVEGGIQSLPKLHFPGGALIGDSAGFLNVPRIKGIHMAMKSGMLAADAAYDYLIEEKRLGTESTENEEVTQYGQSFRNSWAYDELWRVRNIRPSFKWGLVGAFLYSGLEDYILKGRSPWTLRHKQPDNESLQLAKDSEKIHYPQPDNEITFDRLSSVYLSGTNHEENQPIHLTLKDAKVPITINLEKYDAPETRYCPAAVYEIIEEAGKKRLQINAQNCVHCKTCDIKDPTQNIVWVVPEGGGGPNYTAM